MYLLTYVGTLAVASIPLRIYNEIGADQTITEVFLSVDVAPANQAIIVDIHKNGTTIFTNQGNRPSIAAGNNTGNSVTIDVPAWDDGDYLTAHIDQVGSGTLGSDLVIHIVSSGLGGAVVDHDHSGDPGDGGLFDAANLSSGGLSLDGMVLTADGHGFAAWEWIGAGNQGDQGDQGNQGYQGGDGGGGGSGAGKVYIYNNFI
jgi:hypothetical protein